jgi:tetratricopeptide (TPR) repeat protein
MNDILSLLDKWHQDDEYQKIIDCLEELSNTQKLDYDLTCQLARAYNNIADLDREEGRSQLERAEELLRSVADEGQDDPLWHYRLGYSLFYQDREKEALSCFQRALELDPEDEDTKYFIKECEKYIAAKQCQPEMYEQEDWDAVEAHLERYFGPCDNVFHEIMSPDIHVDIYIMKPTPERNYYVLSTFGMGAHRMNVPEELADRKLERAEIIVTLPPDWKVTESGEAWYWPIRWLKILARLPINEDGWLGWGHTIANPDDAPFADNTRLCGVMLTEPQGFDEDAVCCPLPGGDEVNFYQMIPLTFEEMQFKLAHDAQELLDRFTPEQLEVVDIHRESVCADLPQKQFAIPQEELRPLYEGDGPQGCIATDRIVVDGSPVGYCWREEPDPGDEAWDSGWRFTAGDESDAYMDDPDRSGVYALNTICNYDPDVIPLLDSEPGTAWSRGEDGIFRPELYDED